MTVKTEVTAFKIWNLCEPLGWDIKISEVAAQLDLDAPHVSAVCVTKGWMGRLRSSKHTRAPSAPADQRTSDLEYLANIAIGS